MYPSFGGLSVETTGKANEDKEETEEATSDLAIRISGTELPGHELEFTWADVKDAGGITVYSRDGQLSIVQMQNCTERPWRRCSDDGASIKPTGGMIAYIRRIIRSVE